MGSGRNFGVQGVVSSKSETIAMTSAEAFFHVRILVGIITALSLSRLITGLARPVQDQDWHRVGLVHTGWAVFLLLMIVHFWWFELGLARIEKWTFGLYLFVIGYAILLFLICTILFPDQADRKMNLEEYFYSRQKWFYGLLAVIFLVDVADTAFKGLDQLARFRPGISVAADSLRRAVRHRDVRAPGRSITARSWRVPSFIRCRGRCVSSSSDRSARRLRAGHFLSPRRRGESTHFAGRSFTWMFFSWV